MTNPRHHRRRAPGALVRRSLVPPPTPTTTRTGIERKPRERTAPALPPNERAQLVLGVLTDETTGPTELGRRAGLSLPAVTSALYALADRGLAIREPRRGWRRA
jgi:DNA-binding transcriptional ArsR family regulator